MKFLILVIVLNMAATAKKSTKYCSFLRSDVQKHCFLKEVLSIQSHSPNQLAIDRKSNTLYFSFDNGQGEFIPAMLNLDSKQIKILKGVKDAFAIANNNGTGDAYFGGSNGIYKYRFNEKQLLRLSVKVDVWWLHIRKDIYFVQFPSLNAFVYKNKGVKSVEQLRKTIVHQFVFDSEQNVFFVNGSGLYGIKKGSWNHILLRDRPPFFAMAVDVTGQVFVSSEDGIYVVSKLAQKVKRIVTVPGVQGIAFDQNNFMVYSDSHELARLVPVSAEAYYQGLSKEQRDKAVYFC